jgi:uncharacterized membrane protein
MSAKSHNLSPLDFMTIAVLAATFVLTALVYDRLPDPMPTHFDLAGRPNGWMPRPLGAWLLPVLSPLVAALIRFGGRLMPSGWRERLEASPLRTVTLMSAALMAGLHVLVLQASLSPSHTLGGAIWVLLGGMFIALGLVLPRTRRNPFFGIRTAFTLASDENWARTHRVGGYAMTIGGVVVSFAGFAGMPRVAITALIVALVVPVFWSWRIARGGAGDVPRL